VVAVSLLTLTNPFFRDVADAMREQAAKYNYELQVTSGEYLVATQVNQVDNFLTKRVDAIVLFPCDSKAIGTSVVKANKAGIPVFTADIGCMAKEGRVVSHVATDNFAGGEAAARAVIEMLDGRGKVAILDFPEAESVILRTRGFQREIKKAPAIEIVAVLPGGGDKAKSFKAAEDLLQRHPDLNGIFAINDPSALGAVAAVEKAGKQRQVKIVGFDAMPEGRYAVKQGKLYATIVQYPEKIGRTTIDVITRYMAGEQLPPQVLIPCTTSRQAEADRDPTLKPSL
jgi:ribose transport system substrate-binding protein